MSKDVGSQLSKRGIVMEKKEQKCIGNFGSNKKCISCSQSGVCIRNSVAKRMEGTNEVHK